MSGSGNRFKSEKETLDDIIRTILAEGVPISNKTVIMQIMRQITDETDGSRQETLRILLQLVVGYMPDDPASEGGLAVGHARSAEAASFHSKQPLYA
ncbi:biofilm development regulator YmgB/AriR family protein [Pantoea sp. SGAir0418]